MMIFTKYTQLRVAAFRYPICAFKFRLLVMKTLHWLFLFVLCVSCDSNNESSVSSEITSQQWSSISLVKPLYFDFEEEISDTYYRSQDSCFYSGNLSIDADSIYLDDQGYYYQFTEGRLFVRLGQTIYGDWIETRFEPVQIDTLNIVTFVE